MFRRAAGGGQRAAGGVYKAPCVFVRNGLRYLSPAYILGEILRRGIHHPRRGVLTGRQPVALAAGDNGPMSMGSSRQAGGLRTGQH